jgi:hypothetical protein
MTIKIIDTGLVFTGLKHTNKPVECVLHHASGTGTVEAIHNFHKSKGWGGIGYNYYVRKDGKIYKGRPTTAVGCHCSAQGKNRVSIGVCFEGDIEKDVMPQAQIEAGKELCKYIREHHKITKFARHKDYANTDCPGKNFPFAEITKATTTAPATSKAVYKIVAQDHLNVRAGKGASYTIVGKLEPNTITDITDISEGWGKVSSPYTGFVSMKYCEAVTGNKVNPNKSNDWVARLQEACNTLGYSNQRVDGYSGKNTLAGCPELSKGSKGSIVKLLQEHLTVVYKLDCKGVDGSFGAGMESAIKTYQTNNGLKATGIMDQFSWSAILGL